MIQTEDFTVLIILNLPHPPTEITNHSISGAISKVLPRNSCFSNDIIVIDKVFHHSGTFKEGTMGEVIHTSRIRIVREKGPTRKAVIEGFNEPIYYGVHGGIKKFYKVEPEEEHAATLDHIVAATAG